MERSTDAIIALICITLCKGYASDKFAKFTRTEVSELALLTNDMVSTIQLSVDFAGKIKDFQNLKYSSTEVT